jgi:hypothetical protein
MPIEDWKPKEPAMTQKEPATTSQARRPPSGKVYWGDSRDGGASKGASCSGDLVICDRERGWRLDMARKSSWDIDCE